MGEAVVMRMVPNDGLGNPVFDLLNETHEVTLVVRFPPIDDDGGAQRAQFITGVEAWRRQVLATIGELEVDITRIRLRFAVGRYVKQALEHLLWLIRACVDAQETWIGLSHATEAGLEQVLDPRQPTPLASRCGDQEAYLNALFRFDLPAPPAEIPARLRGVLSGSEVWTEERGMALYIPGLRLCYGIARPDLYRSSSTRSAAVAAAVQQVYHETLTKQFAGPEDLPATLSDLRVQQGRCGFAVGNGWKARSGYGFFIEAQSLFTRTGERRFRYREYELFSALGWAADRMQLLPLVTWERSGEPSPWPGFDQPRYYFFQLWEP